MMEEIYLQVEDAIRKKLHLGTAPKFMSMYGMRWHYPIAIELGNIIMRDSDCGLAKPIFSITTDEWRQRVEKWGLWIKTGLWDFTRADDPAANLIYLAHRDPNWAGREIYRLRLKIKETK